MATTNWPSTGKPVIFAIDEATVIDGINVQTAGTYNEFEGIVASATSISNVDQVVGSGDRNYSAGVLTRVYIPVSSERENRLAEGLAVEHKQTGAHSAVTADSIVVSGNVTAANFIQTGGASADGWTVGLPAPNTITNNGNRSYDLVFNSNDITDTVSEGMRLRTTRTVTAPTQCTDLESGSSQYFSKTTPAGMTFPDDFVVSAWIKLESYGFQIIASRYNGTSGWALRLSAAGLVDLVGYNASSANFSLVTTYQSVPLNKWVHVTAQLDMSAFTATTITSYVMIDGVDVPASVSRSGTNPVTLIQAGNLEVGAQNSGTSPFDGKIAQVAIYSAKVTQATIKASMNQTLTGTETSLVSAYSLSNSITDLNTTNANNLTANGGALATNVDSPFGSYLGGTLDYAIITKKAFATNTTLTVQVPEGCTIPTSGGVSAVAYSTQSVPYGFVADSGRWTLSSLLRTASAITSNATFGAFLGGGWSLNVPVGAWSFGWTAGFFSNVTTPIFYNVSKTALTGLNVANGFAASPYQIEYFNNAANTLVIGGHSVNGYENLTAATAFTMYTLGATTSSQVSGAETLCQIYAECAYL